MSRKPRLGVLFLFALNAVAATAAAQLTPQLPAAQEHARLVYEPGLLSDAQFALLAKTIAADTPVPQWPVIRVKKGVDSLSDIEEGEEDILDKAFDVRPVSRLGCQAKVSGDEIEAEITRESRQAYYDEHPAARPPA